MRNLAERAWNTPAEASPVQKLQDIGVRCVFVSGVAVAFFVTVYLSVNLATLLV